MNDPFLLRNCLKYEIERYGWSIGDHSYGSPMVLEHDYGMLTVGRYCSIALGVVFVLGNHRMDLVSTFPFKALAKGWPEAADAPDDHEDRGGIEIGSDVWLGAGCAVVPGVRIGSGAVVAAHCVVTRDVPPYAVVAGNPGRTLRTRFSERQVRDLLEIAWWDWPEDKLRQAMSDVMSADIDGFIDKHRTG